MKRAFKAILAAAFLLGAASTASALQLTVSSGLPATYISQGDTVSGTFDINPSLTSSGFSTPYNVISGTMTFNFADNYDTQTGYSSSSGLEQVQACIGSWCYPTDQYRWIISTTTTNYSPYEGVSVSSAGMTASGGTSYSYNSSVGPKVASGHWSSTIFGDQWVQDTHRVCTSSWGGTCLSYTSYPVYTVSSSINSGYTGDFSVTMDLSNLAITDLNNTGVLDFSLNGNSGNLYFLSASLDVNTIDGNVAPPPSSVPEPSTLLLTVSGLFGFVMYTKRFAESFKRA